MAEVRISKLEDVSKQKIYKTEMQREKKRRKNKTIPKNYRTTKGRTSMK